MNVEQRIAALENRVADLCGVVATQNAMIAQLALMVAAMQGAMAEAAERLPGERANEDAVVRAH